MAGQPVRPSGRDTEFKHFSLMLPRDALMLPHIVGPLLAQAHSDTIAVNLQTSIAHVDQLRRLARDATQGTQVRLAALLLTWVHPDDSVPLGDNDLLELTSSESLPWLLPAFATCIRLLHQSQTARRFAGNMLRHIRAEFDVRELLDPLLHVLRETSNAPVTRASVASHWLKLRRANEDA